MLKLIIFIICATCSYGYFTLPGNCPENVELQQNFNLADFYGKWYQAYHYSSDGRNTNNCSTIELLNRPSGIYVNQSRVDRGLFHRYSMAKLEHGMSSRNENTANMDVSFLFKNAPRRLKFRRYPFHVLATNYNFYATVYTCQYSHLINKHYMYIWILSRSTVLNDVSKELALKSLSQLGVNAEKLVKDDWSECIPKYYEDREAEPLTFRYPVPI